MLTDSLMRWATAGMLAVSALLLARYYVPADYMQPAPVSISAEDLSSLSPAAGTRNDTIASSWPVDGVTVCLSLLVLFNAVLATALLLLWRSAEKLVKATVSVGARQADILSSVMMRPRTREREESLPRKAGSRKSAYSY